MGQEDLRRKEDPKQVQKRAREAREAQELLKREELERQGVDIERLERMSTSIAEADHDERRKQKKAKREVAGFSDWEDMARRKYKRLTRSMKPDLEHYEAEKERLGEDFYPDANALSYGLHGKAAPEKVEHMVNDLAKQYAHGHSP